MQHLAGSQVTKILKGHPAHKWGDETKRATINRQLASQVIDDIKTYYLDWLKENKIIVND